MHSADDWKQQERARRQRELARIIEPEFRPGRVLVVGDCGLARALRKVLFFDHKLAESNLRVQ